MHYQNTLHGGCNETFFMLYFLKIWFKLHRFNIGQLTQIRYVKKTDGSISTQTGYGDEDSF